MAGVFSVKRALQCWVRSVALLLVACGMLWCAARAQAQGDAIAQGTASGSSARDLVGDAVSKDTDLKLVDDAITAFKNRDLEGSLKLLQDAKTKIPKLPPAELLMARLLFAANQLDQGRSLLEKTILAYPNDPEAYILMGDLCMQNKLVTAGEQLFKKGEDLTGKFNDNPDRAKQFKIRLQAGLAAVAEARAAATTAADATKLWQEDISRLKSWAELDPTSAAAQTRLGNALFFSGDVTPGALAAYNKALELDNKLPNPGITIAILTENKALTSTTPAQQQAEKQQNHLAAKKWMEWALLPANAPKNIKNSADLQAHVQQTVLMAANWALQTNEIDFALTQAEKALQQDPKSVDAKILRGLVARFKKDQATAEKQLQAAFDSSPGHFGASNQLAQVLSESRDADKKKKGFEMATVNARQYSKNPEAIATYVWALYQLDRKQEALQALASILQGGNNITSDMAYIAAMVLKDSNQIPVAIQLLEAAGNNKEPFIHRDEAAALLTELKKKAPTTTTP